MSRSWYAKTLAEMSIAKAKRTKRKQRRAATGPLAPRGRTSHLHRDVEEAKRRITLEETEALAKAVFDVEPPREGVGTDEGQ